MYDYIIATDEGAGKGDVDSDDEGVEENKAEEPEECKYVPECDTRVN